MADVWWTHGQRCVRCNKWVASVHVATKQGYDRVCVGCMTREERDAVDRDNRISVAAGGVPGRCWAYRGDGRICGRLAHGVDRRRGYTVCAEHMEDER